MFPDRVRSLVPIATCRGGHRAADRLLEHRPPGHRARPEVARRRLLRRRARRRPARRPGPRPHDLARSPSAATTCSPTASGATSVEPLAGDFELWQRFEVERYLELPRRQAGPPLRRQHLPAAHQGHGPPRPRPGPGRRRGRRWPASRCRRSSMGISSDILYPSYQQRELARRPARPRRRRPLRGDRQPPRPRRLPARASTRSARPVAEFLDRGREGRPMTDADRPADLHPETVAIRAGRADNDTVAGARRSGRRRRS